MKVALDCYLPLPVGGTAITKKGKQDSYKELMEQETYMKSTQEALQELLQEIIIKERTPQGLERVFKVGDRWRECLRWIMGGEGV